VVVARNLDELGVVDPAGDVAARGDGDDAVSRGVHHQCRCGDLGQGGPGIEEHDAVDLAPYIGVRG
jgi:hypothetical protein